MVLGVDGAGVVEALGEGTTRFSPGDRVFGQLFIAPIGSAGTYADYVAVTAEAPLALVPEGLEETNPLSGSEALRTAIGATDRGPGKSRRARLRRARTGSGYQAGDRRDRSAQSARGRQGGQFALVYQSSTGFCTSSRPALPDGQFGQRSQRSRDGLGGLRSSRRAPSVSPSRTAVGSTSGWAHAPQCNKGR
jgi:hypothetical protein